MGLSVIAAMAVICGIAAVIIWICLLVFKRVYPRQIEQEIKILDMRCQEEAEKGIIRCRCKCSKYRGFIFACLFALTGECLIYGSLMVSIPKGNESLFVFLVMCMLSIPLVMMAGYYILLYHNGQMILESDRIIYINFLGKCKSCQISDLKVTRKSAMGNGYVYLFQFHKKRIYLYGGDNIRRLLVRLGELAIYNDPLPLDTRNLYEGKWEPEQMKRG